MRPACLPACLPAAFAGYAVYDVQGARSGLLPVSYLKEEQSTGFTNCIGLFSFYNQISGVPEVNTTLTSLGYNVSWLAGSRMDGLAAAVCCLLWLASRHLPAGRVQQ